MIRPATTADLPTLRAIQTRSLPEPWPALLEPAVDGPAVVLVTTAVGEAEPVGYAVAIPGETGAYLAELAVDAPHRGEGHGSALLDALVERLAARGVSELRTTVRAVDDDARAFYDRHGFAVRDRLPDHYETCDGLRLVRQLSTG